MLLRELFLSVCLFVCFESVGEVEAQFGVEVVIEVVVMVVSAAASSSPEEPSRR